VEDFSFHISAMVNELHVLGDDITDKEVVKKMFHSVLEKLEQVVISMETLLDLNTLSIEEAAGHLRAVEQRRKQRSTSPVADASGRLLLTEEEWTARMKAKSKDKAGSNGSGGNGGGRGRGRGRSRGGGRAVAPMVRAVTLATTAARWATGPVTASPRRRRRRPMQPMMTSRPSYCWRQGM
jgi:uncharacterized membrane protein YgcG